MEHGLDDQTHAFPEDRRTVQDCYCKRLTAPVSRTSGLDVPTLSRLTTPEVTSGVEAPAGPVCYYLSARPSRLSSGVPRSRRLSKLLTALPPKTERGARRGAC